MKTLQALANPVFSDPHRAIKDACVVEEKGIYRLLYSAFFWDETGLRSQIEERTTTDWVTFSEPTHLWTGDGLGWRGFCSPDAVSFGERTVLVLNSWGDLEGKPNQLFYCELGEAGWSEIRPLAEKLTDGVRAIDGALTLTPDGWLLAYKRLQTLYTARALHLNGPWTDHQEVNSGGRSLENFQFIQREGELLALATNFGQGHCPQLFRVTGQARWELMETLQVPPQVWNSRVVANSASLFRFKERWAMLYAGSQERSSFIERGLSSLGLALSDDLSAFEPLEEPS